jgi:hypothetical protein
MERKAEQAEVVADLTRTFNEEFTRRQSEKQEALFWQQ